MLYLILFHSLLVSFGVAVLLWLNYDLKYTGHFVLIGEDLNKSQDFLHLVLCVFCTFYWQRAVVVPDCFHVRTSFMKSIQWISKLRLFGRLHAVVGIGRRVFAETERRIDIHRHEASGASVPSRRGPEVKCI